MSVSTIGGEYDCHVIRVNAHIIIIFRLEYLQLNTHTILI